METSVLQEIQFELKAPKNQFNSFGNYKYRNAEDIQEALKPILAKYGHSLTIADEIVQVGNRIYIKSLARLLDPSLKEVAATTAYAREPEARKGMDEAQVTGATSSYARKYALGGLFLLDDTKDADSMKPDNGDSGKPKAKDTEPPPKLDPWSAKMKALALKNKDVYMTALGKAGYTSASEVPKDKQEEVYKAIEMEVMA